MSSEERREVERGHGKLRNKSEEKVRHREDVIQNMETIKSRIA